MRFAGADGTRRYDTGVVSPFMPEPAKVAAVRTLLPATGAGIYLNAALAGPMPSETQRAMDEQAQRELTTGRGHPDLAFETLERVGEARAAVAAVLVADPDDITLVHGAVDGLRLALETLDWQAGDRLLTTGHETAGTSQLLGLLRDRHGIEVDTVDVARPTAADADEDRVVAAFGDALDRPARAIVASHVLPTTGAVLPLARIGALARAAGASLIVDGSQAAGAMPVSVEDLGVDAYAVPAEAWLLGPEGMGALWRRGGSAPATVPTGLHRPSVVGFARSCGWLSMYVGLPWAHGTRDPARRRCPRPARVDRRRHRADAAGGDGDARLVPDRRLGGGRGPRGARAARVRDHGRRAGARRAAHLGGVLDDGRGARPLRGRRRAAGDATRRRRCRPAAR